MWYSPRNHYESFIDLSTGRNKILLWFTPFPEVRYKKLYFVSSVSVVSVYEMLAQCLTFIEIESSERANNYSSIKDLKKYDLNQQATPQCNEQFKLQRVKMKIFIATA